MVFHYCSVQTHCLLEYDCFCAWIFIDFNVKVLFVNQGFFDPITCEMWDQIIVSPGSSKFNSYVYLVKSWIAFTFINLSIWITCSRLHWFSQIFTWISWKFMKICFQLIKLDTCKFWRFHVSAFNTLIMS